MGNPPDAARSQTAYSQEEERRQSVHTSSPEAFEMQATGDSNYVDTIVIGGGQAGLCTGYYLKKQGVPFLILDANERVGDAWRNRWDSLKLFSPSRYVLPGLALKTQTDGFPTKDQIADYLSEYARHFELPVRNGVRVDRLQKSGDRFVLSCGASRFECSNVIVAMANYQVPRTPHFADEIDPGIVQLHSHTYRNPSQLKPGSVLIVGVGNSGADIALDVARKRRTILSGKEAGHIPWRIESVFARHVLMRLVRFVGHHLLSLGTPIGRKVRPKMLHRTTSLIRVKPEDFEIAGIERVGKTVGVRDGFPVVAGGRKLDVQNIIWCTGSGGGFSWINLPIFDAIGDPMHEQGVVGSVPGLYFVGLHFLYAMSSATFMGIARDAERIVGQVAARSREQERRRSAKGNKGTQAAAA
jgi:putative flavoprotein involved in K+ transport